MNTVIKLKVKVHLATHYGKKMLELHGLAYVKKEIAHAITTFTLGDERPLQNHFNDFDRLWGNFSNDITKVFTPKN